MRFIFKKGKKKTSQQFTGLMLIPHLSASVEQHRFRADVVSKKKVLEFKTRMILIRKQRYMDSAEHQGEHQSLFLVHSLSLCTKFFPRFCPHADLNICSTWQLVVPATWQLVVPAWCAANLCRARGSHGRCHLSE